MVSLVGYLPSKTEWVSREIPHVVFCFILKGRGRLRCGNRWFPVESPCVFVQWPGGDAEYGPEPKDATWEELYVGYDSNLASLFETWGIHPAQQPVWPIASVEAARRLIDELVGCMQDRTAEGMIDRIDRICQRLLLECRLRHPGPPETRHDAYLDHIRKQISSRLGLKYDSGLIAHEYGMSEVTFRRHWKQRFGIPFKHDLINMRMQEACRLLVRTNLEIKEIATRVAFEDSHYFSRRFTNLIGMPATKYRTRNSGDVPISSIPGHP